jgi:hypothetical protein
MTKEYSMIYAVKIWTISEVTSYKGWRRAGDSFSREERVNDMAQALEILKQLSIREFDNHLIIKGTAFRGQIEIDGKVREAIISITKENECMYFPDDEAAVIVKQVQVSDSL